MPKIKNFKATLKEDNRTVKVEWDTEDSSKRILRYGDKKSILAKKGEKEIQIEVSTIFKLIVRGSNGQKNVKKNIKVVVPDSDIASWVSKEASIFTLKNRSLFTIDVSWVNLYGKSMLIKQLHPNESMVSDSYTGHLWKWTDTLSGQGLGEIRLDQANQVVSFTGKSLRSKPNGENKEFQINNLTMYGVKLITIDEQGEEMVLETMEARTSTTLNIQDGTFLICKKASAKGEELAMYYLKYAVSNELDLDLGLDDGIDSVAVRFRNELPLRLSLFWTNPEGNDFRLLTLSPGQTRNINVEPFSRWVLKDSFTGIEVLRTKLGGEQEQKISITPNDLISQKSYADREVELINNCHFLVDVYEVDTGGRLKRVGHLQNGEKITKSTRYKSVFRFKHHRSQLDVGVYLVGRAQDQSYTCDWSNRDLGDEQWAYFKNNTLLDLEVTGKTASGKQHVYGRLAPGEIWKYKGIEGRAWYIRDKSTRQVLKLIYQTQNRVVRKVKKKESFWDKKFGWMDKWFSKTTTPRKTILINDNDLVAKVSEEPVTANITNLLPFAVDLFRITPRGEVMVRSLGSGEACSENSYAYHGWKARSSVSQVECKTWLLDTDTEQGLNVTLRSPASEERTYIVFRNDSSVVVVVYWIDLESELRWMKTLDPGRTFYAQTEVGHFWMVKDIKTSTVLAVTKGLKKGQEYAITGMTAQTQLLGGTFTLKIINNCSFGIRIENRNGKTMVNDSTNNSGVLGAGQKMTLNKRKKGAIWRAYHGNTGEQIGLFLSNDKNIQNFNVNFNPVWQKPILTSAVNINDFVLLFNGAWPAVLNTFEDNAGDSQTGTRGGVVEGSEFFLNSLINEPDCILWKSKDEVWLISGKNLQLYDLVKQEVVGDKRKVTRISEAFPGLPFEELDAAVRITLQDAWMFSGNQVVKYDTGNLQVVQGAKKINECFPDIPFDRVDTGLNSQGNWALFSGRKYVFIDHDTNRLIGNAKNIMSIRGVNEDTLPLTPLRQGELEVFKRRGYTGESWIFRGDCNDLTDVHGFDRSILPYSVRTGPNTGFTGFELPSYSGVNDVFYQDTSTMVDSDLWDAMKVRVDKSWDVNKRSLDPFKSLKRAKEDEGIFQSVKIFQTVPGDKSEIKHTSVLSQDYEEATNGELKETTVYRCNLTFPEDVAEVEVKAAEQLEITVSGAQHTIDAIKSINLSPDGQGKLEITIPAKNLSIPPIQVRMNTMGADEWLVIYPDGDAYKKVAQLGSDDIHNNREKLGINEEFTQENCRSLTNLVQNLSGMAETMGLPPNTIQLGDQPRYNAWGLDFSAVGKKEAIFYPIHKDEIDVLAEEATDVSVGAGQGWKKVWKKVKNEVKDAAEDTVEVVSDVVDETKNTLEDVGDALEDIEGIADLAKTALRVVIKIAGKAYKFVVNSIQKLGAFVDFLIEQAGMVMEDFLDWLKSFFAWNDIIDTHDRFKEGFNQIFTQVVDHKEDIKAGCTQLFSYAETNWNTIMDGLQEQLVGDSAEETGGDNKEDKKSLESPELDWLMNKIMSGMDGLNLNIPNPFDTTPEGSDETIEESILNMFSDLVDVLGDAGQDIINSITGMKSYFEDGISDPKNLFANILGGLLEVIQGLGQAALTLAGGLVGIIIDMMALVMEGIRQLLNFKLDIPILSKLYKQLTNSDLTLLSLISLMLALPTTLLCKAITGEKPFAEGLAQNKREEQTTIALRVTYTVAHFFLGILAFATFEPGENMGKSPKTFLRDTFLYVFTWGTQIAGNPLHPSAFHGKFLQRWIETGESVGKLDHSSARVAGPGMSALVWYYQFMLVGWESVKLVNSFRKNILGFVPWNQQGIEVVDCVLGTGHLTGMLSVFYFDMAQGIDANNRIENRDDWKSDYSSEEYEEELTYLKSVKRFMEGPLLLKLSGNMITTIPMITSPLNDPLWVYWKVAHISESVTYMVRMIWAEAVKKDDHIFVLG